MDKQKTKKLIQELKLIHGGESLDFVIDLVEKLKDNKYDFIIIIIQDQVKEPQAYLYTNIKRNDTAFILAATYEEIRKNLQKKKLYAECNSTGFVREASDLFSKQGIQHFIMTTRGSPGKAGEGLNLYVELKDDKNVKTIVDLLDKLMEEIIPDDPK